MVKIPGGTFLMGSPNDEEGISDSEGPQHEVNVPSFYMGKYAITQAQWQVIMGNNPAKFLSVAA
ncbi:MAG: SUMF1/EgtB/PvdO family nonheme iron enzyme [Spirulinaceae cyanobacterium]